MSIHEELIAFQKRVFRSGTRLLQQDASSSFGFLRSLPCQAAADAISVLQNFSADEFDVLSKVLPKRGKPDQLLRALEEEMVPREQAIVARYNNWLREVASSKRVVGTDRLLESELRALLPEIAHHIGEFSGPIVAKAGETSLFLERELDGMKIKTILEIKGRVPRICYFQHFNDREGQQLNGFPLSILEMCGLSSVTVFDLDHDLTAKTLISGLGRSIQTTFAILLEKTEGTEPNA